MRRIPVALLLFAVLIAALLIALEWIATAAAAAPTPIRGASEAAPTRRHEPNDDVQLVEAALQVTEPVGSDRLASEPRCQGWPEQTAPVRDTAPAGVQVVDAAGRPQPLLPVGLCSTERLTGRPCLLPLGHTDADGFLPLAPHRLGTLVVETAGGRIGSVLRTEATASTTLQLVLQATGALLVDVVNAAGRPIDGARVELTGPGGRAVVSSDATGRSWFPQLALDGELTLRASSAGRRAELRLPAQRPAGRTLHQVVVLDAAPRLLVGDVLHADGSPCCERLLRCTFADGSSLRTTSDAHGRIAIPLPGPPPGEPSRTFDVRLELLDAAGHLSGASAIVNLTPNDGRTVCQPVRLVHPVAAEPRHAHSPRHASVFPSHDRG
ncbi:MAG: carboxypeptidase-like regulatory domain-containing protein [Planctomycetes bacterium]|jgi:hypothetical protein|nr:carboxypeptidase-like regulatory domain-containing protein [Planctomycetota bacterium]